LSPLASGWQTPTRDAHSMYERYGLLQAPFSGPSFRALELVPGALAGVNGEVRYPPPFGLGAAPSQGRKRNEVTPWDRPFEG
jgi:hypothetical protein